MKLSMGSKIVLMIISVAVILSGTCIVVSGIVNRSTMEKEYMITADSMAATVAVTVDGDKVESITQKVMKMYADSDNKISNERSEEDGYEAYTEQFLGLMEDEDYINVRKQLRAVQDVSEVDCVYTLCIDPKAKTAVYIVDAAYEDVVTPGCFDMVEECCYPYLSNLTQGFPAFVTNTKEYGWVVTACAPIYNSKGDVVCFSAVDLSMNEVLEKENSFLLALAGILLFLTIIICVIAIIYVKQKLVKPINMLSEAAGQYGQNQSSPHNEFGSLDIHTGDELEILLKSMKQMEKDIDSYIDNLSQTREQLSSARQQADDMHELAHMDALTGIRNKLAYDKETSRLDSGINDGDTAFGIAMVDLNFLKIINDNYGHECGNKALVKLSRLICEVFAHSPVFRIGGDEFAIILRNNDYDNIESLELEFNRRLAEFANDDSLEEWEKISAAFGYAKYDKNTDRYADDVFKRADQLMYERKKQMKMQKQ